ncbi:melanocortin receptor 5-like [Watersipora subatra]|uniref:melanocortin receptor 5-like n=1 Tax=Watersipora subatra TaxID=2589382 RepID=UPI00355BD7DE
MDDTELYWSFRAGMNWSDGNYSYEDFGEFQDILNANGEYASNRIDGTHVLILVLSIAAFLTNCLALGAICVIRKRLSANQTMMLSLCCADLLSAVGILAVTLNRQFFGIFMVPVEQQYAAKCVYKITRAIILTGHNATLFNLLCLAVDHYCAIAKPLTYSLYMSKRKVHITLSMFWTISFILGFSDFFIPAPLHKHCYIDSTGGYCERVWCSKYEAEHIMFCVVVMCLAIMTTMYGGIMSILYTYQRQGYTTAPQRKARRHIRGLITSLIILGIFAILWLPSCILDVYTILQMKITNDMSVVKMHQQLMLYLYALVVMNAVCDPLVYALRMREIQAGLKTFLRFQRPTFSNKMNSLGKALRNRSSNNYKFPVKYTRRQYSNNSTSTTIYSGASLSERASFSRKGTMTSQVSEMTEDTPLSGNTSMMQFEFN